MIPPILLLAVLVVATVAAALLAALFRKARSCRLATLATTWGMGFTTGDRFQLTSRVASQFPTPGAADVVLRDLIYGGESAGCFRYLFTVEYTTGVLRTKRRRVGVGMLVETAHATDRVAYSPVLLAPADLPLPEQYDWLRRGGQQEISPAATD